MDRDIVYGPVSSWRFGKSLGIDLICGEKYCTFDCLYCQLGDSGETATARRVFVGTEKIIKAVKQALVRVYAEVLTLSGSGEPTLAANMGEVIDRLHELSALPVVVLTNGSTIPRKSVRQELARAEVVKAKLDAASLESFDRLNRPSSTLNLEKIIGAMQSFSRIFGGYFIVEIMFTPYNMDEASELAGRVEEINPDEVQLNTPRRDSPVRQLTDAELDGIIPAFTEHGLNCRAVHRGSKPQIENIIGTEKLKKLKRFKGKLE